MPQAIVDPKDVERFARELKQFNNETRNRMKRLQGQFGRLGETWRDQENKKFAQEKRRKQEDKHKEIKTYQSYPLKVHA